MAKKAQTKKSAKKATKKSPAKAVKKATSKASSSSQAVKKAAKKLAPKKAVKSAVKAAKKVVKKAAKKAATPVKKVVAKNKPVAKKAVTKVVAKKATTKNKVVVKSAPTKVAAKKATPKKAAPKKVVKKAAPKKSIASQVKSTISNISHNVSDFMKDAVSSVIEKIPPENHDNPMSGENAGHTDSSEKEGGNDEEEEEERKPFIKHQTKLKPGDFAPFFEGVDQHGQLINLLSFPGKNIILYFYPKDDTPGCTAEACSLRDEQKYLADRNYAVVGVSADPQKSHAKFAAKYELNFPLLADVDLKIIKDYDVWGLKQFMGKIYDGILRTTFVIAPSGIITEVINEVDTKNHAQQILAFDSGA